jgi:hypothetical protein
MSEMAMFRQLTIVRCFHPGLGLRWIRDTQVDSLEETGFAQ